MPQVITSAAQALARGIYIIFVKAATAAKANGTGRAAMVCQLPWGPTNVETAFGTPKQFRDTFAPDGFPRTSGAYLMATKFSWVDLQIIRISPASQAAATLAITVTGGTLTINAKYKGASGNGITVTVAAATNGVSTSANLTFSKSDAYTGASTTELYQNVDFTQSTSSTYWTTLVANSKLVGPLVITASARPANQGPTNLASGSDGSTPILSDYSGTQGNTDKGIALLESDPLVRFVFTDDPGSGIYSTVNAALLSHEQYMADGRIAVLCGLPGETQATATTNVGTLRDVNAVYHYGHALVNDDVGNTQTIPLTGPWASLTSLMSPHLSPAFKASDFTKFMQAIIGVDVGFPNSTARATLEGVGITAWEQNNDGTITPYTDVSTDVSQQPIYVSRMRTYIMFTAAQRVDQTRNGPNDDVLGDTERTIIKGWLQELKDNRKKDHIFYPCINDFALLDDSTQNSTASLANGDRTVAIQVALIASQRRLFLSGDISTTTTITLPIT